MSIKALSREELPRERLSTYGVENLTDVELIAIILGKGVKNNSVLDVSRNLCNHISLQDLPFTEIASLTKHSGIGKVKACVVKAAIELGRRSLTPVSKDNACINTALDAFTLLQSHLQGNQEKFVVIFLNTRKRVLAIKTLFIGTIDRQLVSTREILKEALNVGSTSVIISHNHPSGDVTPSDADYIVTEKILQALALCHISVADHIVVSGEKYYSFVENGDM